MNFEDAKENIQPLAAGRNASILQAALQSQEELQQQRRHYEDAIANYEGDDPLEPWFEYVYWIEQSYPSGGKESGLDEVLIKCLTKFEKDDRYHQDRRMIKLYIKYIDNHEKPQECYQKLYHQGIGTMVADLYICWAYYFDLMEDFRSADQIFRKGIQCQAQPLHELQEAHQHFGFTMSQRILYNDEHSKEKYQNTLMQKRSVLTSLKTHKKQVGSIRTGAAIKKFTPGTVQVKGDPLSQQKQNAITVFKDENDDGTQLPCSNPTADVASNTSVVKAILDNTRNQENLKEAGPWSKAGTAKKKKLFTSESRTDLGFEILEDQNDDPPIKRKPSDLKPFIYLDGFKPRNDEQEVWVVPITTENQSIPGAYPSYDKCLIYPRPNIEFSLEELGCYFWCKKRNVVNNFTKMYDVFWKVDVESNLRMYPNFAKKNIPVAEKEVAATDFDPLETLTNRESKMAIDLKLSYPSRGEELQFEEILFQRWKSGKKKFKYDCNETIAMTQEMEETMCAPVDGFRRKSFYPVLKPFVPVESPKLEAVETVDEKDERLPAPTPPTHYRKSILKKPVVVEPLAVLTEESFTFKAPSPPPTVSGEAPQQQKITFQIFEDEENNYEANETCSTQAFNCFIKPHSISTPKAPAKSVKVDTQPSERHQIQFNLPDMENTPPTSEISDPVVDVPASAPANQENCPPAPGSIVLSPDYNDAGITMRGKQLSTIMETSEHATGSTGSTTKQLSINTPDFELEVHQSRLPLMANARNLETVNENQSLVQLDASEKLMISIRQQNNAVYPNDISRLEQREDTVSTLPAVRVFEDKTETVPKILIKNFPNEKDFSNLSAKPMTSDLKPASATKKQDEISFFERPPTSTDPPSPIVLNNSIFSTSAFMKFQDSHIPGASKLNDSQDRVVKRVSLDTKTMPSLSLFTSKDDQSDRAKNKTPDLPNLSTNLEARKPAAKNPMEHSFLPGFVNDPSFNLSAGGKFQQNTKDPFLSGFPSVSIGDQKPAEDSFVAYLSKSRQQQDKQAKESEKSLLASFAIGDCSFEPKPSSRDSKTRQQQDKQAKESEKSLLASFAIGDCSFEPKPSSRDSKTRQQQDKQAKESEKSLLASFAIGDYSFEPKPSSRDSKARQHQDKQAKESEKSLLASFAIGDCSFEPKPSSRDSKTRQQQDKQAKASEKSLLASFAIGDCSFEPKPSSRDDKEKSSFMLNLSPPDFQSKNLFKMPTIPGGASTVQQKNTSFLPNFNQSSTAPKEPSSKGFQFYEDTENADLSKKISLLGLNEPEFKPKAFDFSNSERLRVNYSSSQLMSLSSTENARSGSDSSRGEARANKNPNNECFFEDNIRTEAFAVNLSMIKNSTLLPSLDTHQSYIKQTSINIDDCSFSSPTSTAASAPSNSIVSSDCSSNNNQPPPTTQSKKQEECVHIEESDDEPDTEELGKSIYYTKTPKTPSVATHVWTPEPQDEDEFQVSNHFVHQEIDLNHTQLVIDNFCVEKNVNPFSKKLRDAFLNQVDLISYVENLPTCKLVRKVTPLKRDATVRVNDKVFHVLKIIGEGTFGTVYCAKEPQSGVLFALKQEKPANLWEYYICLELESRLHSTEMLSGFMKIDHALIGNNASILFSKYATYGSLITVCNKIKKETTKNVDEYVVMYLTSQLLLIMDHLHASNIIHGDIKADNFVLQEKLVFGRKQPVIQLIDFGSSIDMSLFPKGQTFLYTHEKESFKCVEMREKRPWTYQLDLFGLAGVIHVLLFGKYMELNKKPTGWTHRTHVPRYLNKTLWDTIFHSLLNIHDCKIMPNLQHLRAQLEEELAENDKLVCQKIIEFNKILDI